MTRQPTLEAPLHCTTTLSTLLNPFLLQTTINVGFMERIASFAIGAAVVLIVVRRFLFFFTFLVTGGYLLYRGLTGHCPLYASEQIDTRQWRPIWPVSKRLSGFTSRPMINRSKHYEQDNFTRQMAARTWQPQNRVGPAYG